MLRSAESPSHVKKNKGQLLHELKIDLYALLQTALFIKSRFDTGILEAEFYFKQMQYFQSELLRIQQELSPFGMNLMELVEKLPSSDRMSGIVAIISTSHDYQYNGLAQQWQINPLQLASAATSAVSQFITIIDYLHLTEEIDGELLMEMVQKLRQGLRACAVFQPFYDQIATLESKLYSMLMPNHDQAQRVLGMNATLGCQIKAIEDQFYQILTNLQQYLRGT